MHSSNRLWMPGRTITYWQRSHCDAARGTVRGTFSHKLCVKGAVLSDGKGGSVSVANSCSVLANPNTSTPTPSPTPRPAFMDLALRFAATTSAAFDVSVRRALRQAVSTATMIPMSDVHLIRVMPGGNNAGYYVDVTFALAAPTLEYVNRVEDRVVTHEAFFVSTVVDRLFAQGVHFLARKGAESRLSAHFQGCWVWQRKQGRCQVA